MRLLFCIILCDFNDTFKPVCMLARQIKPFFAPNEVFPSSLCTDAQCAIEPTKGLLITDSTSNNAVKNSKNILNF